MQGEAGYESQGNNPLRGTGQTETGPPPKRQERELR